MKVETLEDKWNMMKGCLKKHAPHLYPLYDSVNIHEIRSYVNVGIFDVKKVLLNKGYIDKGKGVFTRDDTPEFERYIKTDEYHDTGYNTKTKIDGKTGFLYFQEYEYPKGYDYNILFSIKNKKKDTVWRYKQSTGLTDPRFLFWAKKQMIKFEKFIITQKRGDIKISVRWDDSRRKRVYTWGLSKIGYKKDNSSSQLYKYIRKL
jgi:hypothetical protein